MVKNSNYFYISGFLSLSLFIFFISLFIYMMFNSSKVKTFALKKDNYISISLEIPDITPKKDMKSVKKIEDSISTLPSIKEPIQTQDVDVEDLFSDVWAKKITKVPKKEKRIEKKLVNAKVLKALEKKIKTLDKSDKKKSIKEFEIAEKTPKEKDKNENKASTAEEVNEYLAKIKALVYKHFEPPHNSQGYSVKAVIELSAIGKVKDFRILNYSVNDALNKECEKIKIRLMSVVFPINPKNKFSRTIVILTSKE